MRKNSRELEKLVQFIGEQRPELEITRRENGDVALSMPGEPMCDFCSTRPVVDNIGALSTMVNDALSEIIPQRSEGAWATCADCKALVKARDRKGLEDRAVRIMAQRVRGFPPALLRSQVRASHEAFWIGHAGAN